MASAGLHVPDEWGQLLERFAAAVESADSAVDRYITAVVTPTAGQDLVAIKSGALAEQIARTGDESEINERLRAAVFAEMARVYAPHAKGNYQQAAQRYDQLAKHFTKIAETADVEADGSGLVAASPAARSAWFDAPGVAAQLDSALAVLCCAASLAGAPPDAAFVGQASDTQTNAVQIALSCQPGKAHRRRVWHGWSTTTGRCGRWSKLVAEGVKLVAAKDPTVPGYPEPVAFIRAFDRNNVLQNHDPHDGPLPYRWRPVQDGWMGEPKNLDHVQ
jgi:hypothetical protein